MRGLVFLKYIFLTIVLGLNCVSYAQLCNLSNVNQIAEDFLKHSPSTHSIASRKPLLPIQGNGSGYDRFRRAYNTGRIEGDNRFVSYVDENGRIRAAYIHQIKENGEVELRDSQGIVTINGDDLKNIRVSENAKQHFQSRARSEGRRSRTPRASPAKPTLPETTRPAYNEFRRAYNTGRIEGDNRFVSYVDENGKRRAAYILKIKRNGEVELRDSQGIVTINGSELKQIRVSATAKEAFQNRIQNGNGFSPRAPPSGPALRADTYNRNYQRSRELAQEQEQFERSFSTYAIDPDEAKKIRRSRQTIHPSDNRGVYYGKGKGEDYWIQFNSGNYNQFPLQGWKFHISAKPENAAEIAEKVLPILQRENIDHKIVNPKYFDDYVEKIGDPSRTQQGKFITVYPRNKEEAKRYAQILKQVMEKNNFNRDDFINIPNEYEIAPGIFVRYGRLGPGDLRRPDGSIVNNSAEDILTPDGQIIKDPRGQNLPDFVQEEMFELFQ